MQETKLNRTDYICNVISLMLQSNVSVEIPTEERKTIFSFLRMLNTSCINHPIIFWLRNDWHFSTGENTSFSLLTLALSRTQVCGFAPFSDGVNSVCYNWNKQNIESKLFCWAEMFKAQYSHALLLSAPKFCSSLVQFSTQILQRKSRESMWMDMIFLRDRKSVV